MYQICTVLLESDFHLGCIDEESNLASNCNVAEGRPCLVHLCNNCFCCLVKFHVETAQQRNGSMAWSLLISLACSADMMSCVNNYGCHDIYSEHYDWECKIFCMQTRRPEQTAGSLRAPTANDHLKFWSLVLLYTLREWSFDVCCLGNLRHLQITIRLLTRVLNLRPTGHQLSLGRKYYGVCGSWRSGDALLVTNNILLAVIGWSVRMPKFNCS